MKGLRLLSVLFVLAASEGCIDIVNSTIATLFGQQCDGMRKAMYGHPLLVWEWKQTCGPCYSAMGGKLVGAGSDCAAAITIFNDVTDACGGCVTAAPATSPIDTAGGSSSSGSDTSVVELTGPISTIFIVGVCLIICIVGSSIWYCYIRKSPEEKVQEAKLRNFNMLDIQPKKKQSDPLLDRGQTYHAFPTKRPISTSPSDDNLYPVGDSPKGEYHNAEMQHSFDKPKGKLFV